MALLIGAFVNFVFANSVFMHTHMSVDGHTVTHSHPYLPTQGHTHTSAALGLIASFNVAADAFEGTSVAPVYEPSALIGNVYEELCDICVCFKTAASALRGPPSLG